MTKDNPLAALIAKWRAAHKETHDSPHFLDQYDYGTADGLNEAADELEAELLKMCDSASTPCEHMDDNPTWCFSHYDGIGGYGNFIETL
jgi:hypothetical protein